MTVEMKKIAGYLWPRYSRFLDAVNRNACVVKWARKHADLPYFSHRYELYEYLNRQIIHQSPIDYLEFGVFKGASFKKWVQLNSHEQSRFIGFDSFEGLPEDWEHAFGKTDSKIFDIQGRVLDVNDTRASFRKGWFQDTLPKFLQQTRIESQLIVHIDSDLYSSSLYTLASLNSIMAPGTIIIFDEYSSPLNEFRAWNDYLTAFRRHARPLAASGRYFAQVAFQLE